MPATLLIKAKWADGMQNLNELGSDGRTRFDVSGDVVVVTGGGKGIGKVYCENFARAGACVVVADIDGEAADAVAAAINGNRGQSLNRGQSVNRGQSLAVRTDIADPASVSAMAEAALARFGAIDGLVNNASLMSSLPRRSWLDIPLEEWDSVMAVNLRGLFLCCRAVVPAMRAKGRGKIVNISSSRVWEGTPNRLHYTTSKAGVIGFTRALAREVGHLNITVNAVTPGLTLSDTQLASSDPTYLKSGHDELRALQRAQTPDDLVGTVMFLISRASDFLSGQTINVDGGKAMH